MTAPGGLDRTMWRTASFAPLAVMVAAIGAFGIQGSHAHAEVRPSRIATAWFSFRLPSGGDHTDLLRWLAHTNQEPPVALQPYLPRFVARYTVWSAIDGKKPTFAAWLLIIGVIDPSEHQAMVLLHQWALRGGLIAE